MSPIFHRLSRAWERHGWSILVGLTVAFFLVYWLLVTRHHSRGTYSTTYYYNPYHTQQHLQHQRRSMNDGRSVSSNSSTSSSNSKRRVQQTSRGETVCKNHLEYIFQRPFQKCRPPFLYNEVTNDYLELDMYNPELRVACEYNGRQHYEYVPFLHGHSRANFQNQMYRDKEKRELCRKHGIHFIVVPYTVPLEKISAFINNEIRRLGIKGVQKPIDS